MDEPAIALEELSEPERRQVDDALVGFNIRAAGPHGHRRLGVSLRQGRRLSGACIGATYWEWLYVDMLWVDGDFRGRGYGRTLLRLAEDEARARGCRNAYLDSFSFQAPDFYRKLGYAEFGRLPDFPKGHARIFLTKAL